MKKGPVFSYAETRCDHLQEKSAKSSNVTVCL